MARKKESKNILDLIPVRARDWGEGKEDEGTVQLKVPRFESRLGKRFCRWIKKSPTYNVNLDKYGSEAWKLCDGNRTVGEIAERLREKYGDEVKPAYERVAELMSIMEINGLITYKKVNSDSDEKGK